MSNDDDTRPLPADDTRPIPADDTRPIPADVPETPIPTDERAAMADETGHIRVVQPPAPPAAPVYAESRPAQRGGTVVWGLVIVAIGVGLLAVAWGAYIDAELALIVLLGAAGLALLIGSLATMWRSRAREEGRG